MARRLTTNNQIDAFINKVIGDADHHAPEVAQIILPLSQAVRARLNLAQDRVEVYERLGQMGRACWVTLGGTRYAFSYKYGDEMIYLRAGSLKGSLIFQFDNQTTVPTIRRVVAGL